MLKKTFSLISLLVISGLLSADEPSVDRQILRKQGDDGVHTFRIPGLAVTPAGTLLAVFDLRHQSPADLPQDIDVGILRSLDHGDTWSPVKRILDFDKNEPGSLGNGVGDPAILVDSQTKTIFVAALWSKGNRAWKGSGPGLSPEETGQLVLTKSTDDGLSWSPPVNITSEIRGRDPKWRLFFCGPGNGIQLRNGTLVFAAQFREPAGPPHSCLLFSGDHGRTWTVSPPAIPEHPATSEAQVAELPDGSLLITMRDESRSGLRCWARWTWNHSINDDLSAGHWSEPWHVLPDPVCMASLITLSDGTLCFSNPNSSTERIGLTIRTSADGGRSWTDGRLVEKGDSMYSSLTLLQDGRIAVLYESEGSLKFSRFSPAWLNENQP